MLLVTFVIFPDKNNYLFLLVHLLHPINLSFYTLIFGVLLLCLQFITTSTFLPYLKITVDLFGLFFSNPNSRCLNMLKISLLLLKISFISLPKPSEVIMVLNFYSLPSMLQKVLHIIGLVLKLPNKMGEFRESINIFWMQAKPSYISLNCLHHTGRMPFYMPLSSSIESHHFIFTINHVIICFIIIFLMFIVSMSLVHYVTPLLFKHIEQNYLLEQENLCF